MSSIICDSNKTVVNADLIRPNDLANYSYRYLCLRIRYLTEDVWTHPRSTVRYLTGYDHIAVCGNIVK